MSAPLPSTPRRDGYRMPGEFEPHAGCWMLWPARGDVWRAGARPAQAAFAAVAGAIARFESVTVGVAADGLPHARAQLPPAVNVLPLAYNDAWMRDNGPTFVVSERGDVRAVDWRFNAWGGLYANYTADDALAATLCDKLGIGWYRAPLVMEGGAFHVDGEGTALVTEQCLLHPGRNPGWTKAAIEAALRDYLNVDVVIWLGDGVIEDETAGHVDNLACFVRPGVVALTWTDDVDDPQHAVSADAFARLTRAVDARGRRLTVHKLHQPGPLWLAAAEAAGIAPASGTLARRAGRRLAASYVNYYVANGGVIVPQFDDPHDLPALEALQALYPDRQIIGVYAREILLGGGNIHCITQQQPA